MYAEGLQRAQALCEVPSRLVHKRNERERSSATAHDTQTLKERMLVGSGFSLVFLELVLELVDLDCHLSVAHGG